jgi:hypothetical protein
LRSVKIVFPTVRQPLCAVLPYPDLRSNALASLLQEEATVVAADSVAGPAAGGSTAKTKTQRWKEVRYGNEQLVATFEQ